MLCNEAGYFARLLFLGTNTVQRVVPDSPISTHAVTSATHVGARFNVRLPCHIAIGSAPRAIYLSRLCFSLQCPTIVSHRAICF